MEDNVLGKIISEELKKQGMKQKELAEKCQTSTVTVCRWVNGKHKPRNSTIVLISNILGVEYQYLKGGVK